MTETSLFVPPPPVPPPPPPLFPPLPEPEPGTVTVLNLWLDGTAGNDSLTGGTGNDTLIGNGGNDTLNGGLGNDSMAGGLGNDIYYVNTTLDVVVEAASAGTDTVISTVSRTLGANFENLTLSGTAAINGTGNTLNNLIAGNSANNTLNGAAGNDTLNGGLGNDSMVGGLGNDIYYVNTSLDVVVEAASAGTDTVISTVSRTLGANFENLTLSGTGAINGTGNTLNNRIAGNSANNTLNGAAGNDTLTGGAGNDILIGGAGSDSLTGGTGSDRWLYNTGAAFTAAAVGADIISDFVRAQGDKIILDKTTFTAISSAAGTGFSNSAEFRIVGSDAAAATSGADIVYNSANGHLFYNQNGAAAGFGTGALLATFTGNPSLAATDFIIQA